MRTAVFTDNFYPELGGIQDSILTVSSELGARGHQVMILAPSASARDYARVNRPPTEVDLGVNVQICRLPALPVPSSSQQSRWAIPTARDRRRVTAFAPDLIHSHGFLSAGWAGLRLSRKLGLPLVGTNHWAVGGFDMYLPFARKAFGEFCNRAVTRYFQKCTWVTAPSRSSVETMGVYGLNRHCSVISNPINTTLFHPVSEEQKQAFKTRLKLGDAVIVAAGRLGREKRLDVLIRAVALVKQQVPNVSLVIAGHGSARAGLEALAQELGLGEQIRFVGTLDQEALAMWFAAAEVFAIASTSETQSMVLLQAMACGLPVVGVRSGGLTEHIPPTVGYLAAPGQSEDFADKLVKILNTPAMAEKMRQAAISFAGRFSVSAIADAWVDLYSKLLHGDAPESSEPVPVRSMSCI